MTIVKRLVKGTPLTYAEGDGNLTDLDDRATSLEEQSALKLLEQNGAVFSGAGSAAADTAAIQALINAHQSLSNPTLRKTKLILPQPANLGTGIIYLNAGLSIDIGKCGGIYGNNMYLDFSAVTSGAYLTIHGSSASGYPMLDENVAVIEGLRILGNDQNGSAVALDATAYANHFVLRDIMLKNVGIGERHGANVYIVKHYNVNYFDCGLCVQSIAGGTRGENLSWYGGVMANSEAGFALTAVDASIYGMSMDFCGPLFDLGADTGVNVFGGHIEMNYEGGDWFTATGNGTVLNFHGVDLRHTGTAPQSNAQMATATFPARIRFNGCRFNNFRNTAEVFGVGDVRATGSMFYNNSNMPYSLASLTSSSLVVGIGEAAYPLIGQVRGAANWAGRYTGTNLVVAQSAVTAHTATGSMEFTKSGGAGAAAFYDIFVPITNGAVISLSHWYRDPAAAVTGSYLIDIDSVHASKDENGLWSVVLSTDLMATGAISADDTWRQTGIRPDGNLPVAAWATHLRVSFDFTASGNGPTYIDDLQIDPW